MAPVSSTVHLPNGQNLTIVPVFGGYFFKIQELNTHPNYLSVGWTVIIQSESFSDDHEEDKPADVELSDTPKEKKRHIRPFKQPTLSNDNLFISSISNPSSNDFIPPTSPSRQIAMMLWASLYWYFHLQPPSPYLETEASKNTPPSGRPKGEWRINIKREGVLRGRNLIQKLERMGLITSEDSSVGLNPEENTAEGWSEMFISRRAFWQLSATLFLFTLSPANGSNVIGSPYNSRPTSPVPGGDRISSSGSKDKGDLSPSLWSPSAPGPFSSGSHLPTYFPPPPLQYIFTSGIRHPIRPKPPRQGEVFYTRYIPSVGQYLSFRTASLSSRPVAYTGPTSSLALPQRFSSGLTPMTDLQLLNKWMNVDRVAKFWGCAGPPETQEAFLKANLTSHHSFPAIGLWDGKPFGYFEIYWVKEDVLGKYLGDRAGDYDRGLHVLVGEDDFRGKHRVNAWISSLAHWAFVKDYRTNAVVLEPRVDNERYDLTLLPRDRLLY